MRICPTTPSRPSIVASPTHAAVGGFTLNGNGTFSYHHDGSAATTDSFTYRVTDAVNHTSNTTTVSIAITPTNVATPVANADSITVAEGGTATSLVGGATSVLTNDTDADLPNDTLTAAIVTGPTPRLGLHLERQRHVQLHPQRLGELHR